MAPSGFSAAKLQAKMQRIPAELPAWVSGHPDRQKQATSLNQKLQPLIKDKKWQEVDKIADEILSLITTSDKK